MKLSPLSSPPSTETVVLSDYSARRGCPMIPRPPRLNHVRGVVLGIDEFDDEVDRVALERLRQVLAQLGDPRPARLH